LAARGVSWAQVGGTLAAADYELVVLAASIVVGVAALRTWCWMRLYGPTPSPVPFSRAWGILLAGQLLNFAVPARSGDMARVYLVSKAGSFPMAAAATSLFIEKFFDLTSCLLIVLLISVWVELPAALVRVRVGLVLACLTLTFLVFVGAWRAEAVGRWLERRERLHGPAWWSRLAGVLEVGLQSLAVLRRWQWVLALQIGYLTVWGSLGFTAHLVLLSVGLDLPLIAGFVVLAVTQLGSAVPSTPGKVGVFQYLSVLALMPFGVSQDLALTYGILLYLVSYLPPVVMGSVGIWVEFPGLREAGVIAARDATGVIDARR
jgi:hypothetical protein